LRIDGGFETCTFVTDGGFTADIPVTDGGFTADIPVTDGGFTADIPVTDGGFTADIPVTDGGFATGMFGTDAGFAADVLATDAGFATVRSRGRATACLGFGASSNMFGGIELGTAAARASIPSGTLMPPSPFESTALVEAPPAAENSTVSDIQEQPYRACAPLPARSPSDAHFDGMTSARDAHRR
jgi:hypothetical protein